MPQTHKIAAPQKRSADRSKVQRAGRAVTEAEVLTPEHDALVIKLHSLVAEVCDRLFGLTQEELEKLELKHLDDGLRRLEVHTTRLRELLTPTFTYDKWQRGRAAGENRAAAATTPSKPIFAAAQKALQVLEHLKKSKPPDLYSATLVKVTGARLQTQLTQTVSKNYDRKRVDLGYVDLYVEFQVPPWVETLLLVKSQPLELSELGYFSSEAALLKQLQQVSDATVLGYRTSEPMTSWEHALFTVRTGEFTLMEALQEMRNLTKSDQGFNAKIVLIAPSLPAEWKDLIWREGFFALDDVDLAALRPA